MRDPNDRRGVLIEMTDKANKAVGEIWSLVVKAGEQMLAMASEADLRVILAFLEGARALQLSHLARRRTSGGGDKHQEKIDRRADPGHDQKPVRSAKKRKRDHEIDEIAARGGVEESRQRPLGRIGHRRE